MDVQPVIEDDDGDILVVDDSPVNLRFMSDLLTRAGHRVRGAPDAAAAFRCVEERLPALVLLDVRLPDMDGYEVCRRLKRDERTQPVPVLFISGMDDEDSRVLGFQVGGVDYISKPFNVAEALARVKTHLLLRQVQVRMAQRNEELEQARRRLEEDVAARQRIEEALRRSEEKFSRAFRSSPLIVTITALDDHRLLDVNEGFVRHSGYSREEAIGRTSIELGLWGDPGQMAGIVGILLQHGEVHDVECRFRVKRGREIIGLFSAERLVIDGRVCAISTIVDITARKRAEEALRVSEERQRAVWDNLSVGVVVIDPDMRVLSLNRQMRVWNPGVDPATHPVCWQAFNRPAQPGVCPWCPTVRTFADGQVHEAVSATPTEDGVRHYRIVASPLRDADGNVAAVVELVEDVTEAVRAEAEKNRIREGLVRLQRLEAVGTLAGGVAHDINNPLNVVMNFAQLIADEASPDGPIAESVGHILAESQRIERIVHHLLSFAQQERFDRRLEKVQDLVDAALGLLRHDLEKAGIRVAVRFDDDVPRVSCRGQQIQQVLLNLLTNARDALDERYPEPHPDKTVSISVRALAVGGREGVRITVENRGTVIPARVLPRLFEPFFTTKSRGVGTGLGLSVSHGIVVGHGGALSVESGEDGGTRFFVDLPVAGD